MRTFPDGFLWGAATAPHQVEGNNVNSDFWAQEERMPGADRSGDALDSYHRYAEDVRLVAESGLNTYRFGIEWARIEPAPGRVSRAALTHYRRIACTTGALDALSEALGAGVDVQGYIHWSLLDNYEWGHWDPTFGLVAVDRETFERRPKPSLAWLGGVAKANAL